MTKFLRLKPRQLFIIFMAVPLAVQFLMMSSVRSGSFPKTLSYLSPILLGLSALLFFGWLYAVGTNLYKKLPETATMNLTRFKLFLFIPMIYLLVLSVFIGYMFSRIRTVGPAYPETYGLIIPFHLFSMFCIFHSFYFIAKALKTVEWQKPVTFSDFSNEFFCCCFM